MKMQHKQLAIFFFKQKTAYEIYQCDWSSDVCSSDLDLGTGKTTLVRGVLRALGYQGAVKSPTYTLLEEYSLSGREIIHFDLYRLIDPEELDLIGIRDYFNGKTRCFVEWPDRGRGYLPPEDLVIRISHRVTGREVRISAASDSGREIIGSIQTALCQGSG